MNFCPHCGGALDQIDHDPPEELAPDTEATGGEDGGVASEAIAAVEHVAETAIAAMVEEHRAEEETERVEAQADAIEAVADAAGDPPPEEAPPEAPPDADDDDEPAEGGDEPSEGEGEEEGAGEEPEGEAGPTSRRPPQPEDDGQAEEVNWHPSRGPARQTRTTAWRRHRNRAR